MSKNKPGMIFALAASLVITGCGGARETSNVKSSEATASSNANASAPAADTAASANAANAANATTPAAAGGDAARPGATSGGGSRTASGATPANVPKPQIGSGGNDLYLFTRARGVIGADAELKAANIVVEVKGGVATLSGTVASDAQKSKAEQLTRGVGVTTVKNQLRVSAGK